MKRTHIASSLLALVLLAFALPAALASASERGSKALLAAPIQGAARSGPRSASVSPFAPAAMTYVVTNTNDSGVGSLRQAILDANANSGADTINFAIPGPGVHTITPALALPDITDPVNVNGYSQVGSVMNGSATAFTGTVTIELNGSNAGSGADGLKLRSGAGGSTIQGLAINRFAGNGLNIQTTSGTNSIQGNLLGTDPTGKAAAGNNGFGVYIYGSPTNVVGGAAPANRNVISGNRIDGVTIVGVPTGNASNGNVVQGNMIGTDATGTTALPNQGNGLSLADASSTLVGGLRGQPQPGSTENPCSGACNLIAFNSVNGVVVVQALGGTSISNTISANSIYSNAALGIDLNGDGVTTNDPTDPDSGPNDLQNYPVLQSAVNTGGGPQALVVSGSLNSRPNRTYNIEFFANAGCDTFSQAQKGIAYGEGQTYIGNVPVTTDASGNAFFAVPLTTNVPTNQFLTSTATEQIGGPVIINTSTSEFSNCIPVTGTGTPTPTLPPAPTSTATPTLTATPTPGPAGTPLPTPTVPPGAFIVNTTADTHDANTGDGSCVDSNGQCSLRAALEQSNASSAALQFIIFGIPGTGVQTINVGGGGLGALPAVQKPVFINGFTQPGSVPNVLASGDNAQLKIVLDGSLAGAGAIGLNITGGGSTVMGLDIRLFASHGIQLSGGGGNTIQGNFIGTDPTGNSAQANQGSGIFVLNSSNNVVGGTTPAARNLVSGNHLDGVTIGATVGTSTGNMVQGNMIGSNAAGSDGIPNGADGVSIGISSNNTIGGSTGTTPAGSTLRKPAATGPCTGACNLIAFNSLNGVTVAGAFGLNSVNDRISRNAIFSNVLIGIDLDANGVTPNDPGDPDTGANNRQNFPVLTSANSSGGAVTIMGSLNSTPNSAFTVEFFSNDACDTASAVVPGGPYGEGQSYIGSAQVATDAGGNGSFVFLSAVPVPGGSFVTSTATDGSGNTSEFSNCLAVLGVTPTPTVPELSPLLSFGTGLSGLAAYALARARSRRRK